MKKTVSFLLNPTTFTPAQCAHDRAVYQFRALQVAEIAAVSLVTYGIFRRPVPPAFRLALGLGSPAVGFRVTQELVLSGANWRILEKVNANDPAVLAAIAKIKQETAPK